MAAAEKPKLHPLALGGNRPRAKTMGRPLEEGERYPSGRLKPVKPNPLIIRAREALGVTDPQKPCMPLKLAYDRGWLTDIEFGSGRAYAGVYSRAQLGSPGVVVVTDTSIQSGVEDVPDVKWGAMPRKVIAQIWDSAMRDVVAYEGPDHAHEKASRAMARWKQMSAAMTLEQRNEVDAICLRAAWPEWLLEKALGRVTAAGDRRFHILKSGLTAIGMRVSRPMPANDHAANDDVAPKRPRPPGPLKIETQIFVDERGPWLEVERIKRRPAG